MKKQVYAFLRSERGSAIVEFVALMPAFLGITFFIFEIAIAILWIGTAEKAAQLGARLAVVSNYAVTTLAPTQRNVVAMNALYGQQCPGGCVAFATATCSGGGGVCSAGFTTIVNRMRGIMPNIQTANVTITYQYIGLGYAGGPIVPRVVVTVSNVAYGAIITTLVSNLFTMVLGGDAPPAFTTLPPITVTLTGEDLNTAGAP